MTETEIGVPSAAATAASEAGPAALQALYVLPTGSIQRGQAAGLPLAIAGRAAEISFAPMPAEATDAEMQACRVGRRRRQADASRGGKP